MACAQETIGVHASEHNKNTKKSLQQEGWQAPEEPHWAENNKGQGSIRATTRVQSAAVPINCQLVVWSPEKSHHGECTNSKAVCSKMAIEMSPLTSFQCLLNSRPPKRPRTTQTTILPILKPRIWRLACPTTIRDQTLASKIRSIRSYTLNWTKFRNTTGWQRVERLGKKL